MTKAVIGSCTHTRWSSAEVPAESAVEIGQIGEAGFGGNGRNLAMTPARVAQQRGGLFETPLQHVMA